MCRVGVRGSAVVPEEVRGPGAAVLRPAVPALRGPVVRPAPVQSAASALQPGGTRDHGPVRERVRQLRHLRQRHGMHNTLILVAGRFSIEKRVDYSHGFSSVFF